MLQSFFAYVQLASDTVGRSGMFCAIATTIEKCKTEGVVDVFQIVKALRVQKPGAVTSVVSCHVAVLYVISRVSPHTRLKFAAKKRGGVLT